MELMLLALLGVAAAGLIFDGGSDPETDNDEPISVPVGGSTTGTDGDDTIIGASPGRVVDLLGGTGDDLITFDQAVSIDAGEGDDTVRGGDLSGIEGVLYGGQGDDLLDLAETWGRVLGGDGNDTITSGDNANSGVHGGNGDDHLVSTSLASSTYGDAGNDDITLTETGPAQPAAAYGGEGDDTLRAEVDLLDDEGGFVLLDGGDGTDRFMVEVSGTPRHSFESSGGGPGAGLQSTICRITDFDPSNEHLDVLIAPSEGAYQGFRVETGATGSAIILEYVVANPNDASEVVTLQRSIMIQGVPNLTDADFTLTVQP